MRHLNERAPQNIVIFRALQLGDLLCTVPTFRALRSAYPKANISLVGLPWAASFVQRFSKYLDAFIEFPGWPGLPEQEPKIDQIPVFLEAMQSKYFDLVLQLHGAGTITNPLVSLFGARTVAGFYLPGQFIPKDTAFFPYPAGENEVLTFLQLLQSLEIHSQGEQLEFPVSAQEREAFTRFCTEHDLEPGHYVVIHPGARDEARRWSTDGFAAVGNELSALGFSVVITGTEAENNITRAVRKSMRTPVLDAAGLTDLGVLALLIDNARLLVSNDTGVSHIAAAFETPSVILFSNSDPDRWRPLNRRLHRAVLNTHQAATQITTQLVLDEAISLLREVKDYAKQLI